MEMKTVVLLTGGSPTKTYALLEDIGVSSNVTKRQLSYSLQKMNDAAMGQEDTDLFLSAMTSPAGALQEKASVQFNALHTFFMSFGGSNTEAAPTDAPLPEGDTLITEGEDDEDLELFAEEAPVTTPPAVVDESVVEEEASLPWDEDEDDLSFLDEPAVGAEPVSYDRSTLENDDAKVTVETTVDEDDIMDLFS